MTSSRSHFVVSYHVDVIIIECDLMTQLDVLVDEYVKDKNSRVDSFSDVLLSSGLRVDKKC